MNIDTYYIVLIVLIIVMYCITQICDVVIETFKNKGVKNENTKEIKKK